jgi:C_GCAxxG_C_C family probable redox protein
MQDLIIKYQDKEKYDLSCSETILYAANEYYNLGLDEKSFKMMAPFSGGMYVERTCGIVTASLAVIGLIFTDEVAHNSPIVKELSKKYIEKFENRYGTSECRSLKAEYRDDLTGCFNLIKEASDLLVEVVNEGKAT